MVPIFLVFSKAVCWPLGYAHAVLVALDVGMLVLAHTLTILSV